MNETPREIVLIPVVEYMYKEIPCPPMYLIRDIAEVWGMSNNVVVSLAWMKSCITSSAVNCRHYENPHPWGLNIGVYRDASK